MEASPWHARGLSVSRTSAAALGEDGDLAATNETADTELLNPLSPGGQPSSRGEHGAAHSLSVSGLATHDPGTTYTGGVLCKPETPMAPPGEKGRARRPGLTMRLA
ncbi:hypothetical protein AAFF_G00154910 [Aldrovandia affinis]|uniref:Uncharacterized protein n=1 Tax=Aldrovandia affinis TaxID=143900 RepID=A0AAD7WWS8_9TELE|nr:hypothetical protein AAFF_G00154910 [Aldrovandia affinis]